VMEVPGRTSRTIPASGVSIASLSVPPAIRQRFRQAKTSSPSPNAGRPSIEPDQRLPGCGSSVSGTWTSSRLGSRRRSAIGAPTTTDSPAATRARSPGASPKRTSTGRPRAGRRGSAGYQPPPRSFGLRGRPRPATRRGSPRRSARSGNRRARRAGRPAGHRAAGHVDREVTTRCPGGRCRGTGDGRGDGSSGRSCPWAGSPA
jgi:hypothetical protein